MLYLAMATETSSINVQDDIPEKPHEQVHYKFLNAQLGKRKHCPIASNLPHYMQGGDGG